MEAFREYRAQSRFLECSERTCVDSNLCEECERREGWRAALRWASDQADLGGDVQLSILEKELEG
jgi:hypothetical protein